MLEHIDTALLGLECQPLKFLFLRWSCQFKGTKIVNRGYVFVETDMKPRIISLMSKSTGFPLNLAQLKMEFPNIIEKPNKG